MADLIRDGILLGCGNPLLDISAIVDYEFLQKYDLKPDDISRTKSTNMTIFNELIDKYQVEFTAGGSAQNSLRVCQWILQRPNTSVFFGSVGNDNNARILETISRSNGVNVQYYYTNDEPTGTCAVLINGTHRSLCPNIGAAKYFSIEHLQEPENLKKIENAEFFYIEGFFLAVSLLTVKTIAKHTHKNNCPFMMNLSASFLADAFKEPLMDTLSYVDILFGNKSEAQSFASEQGWEINDIVGIGKKLVAWPKKNFKRARIVVITQGPHPVLLIQKEIVKSFPVKKLKTNAIVDTNGAGDAFVGGFLAQYIQKKSLDTCVRTGIWAARQIIQRFGCTVEGIPDFEE